MTYEYGLNRITYIIILHRWELYYTQPTSSKRLNAALQTMNIIIIYCYHNTRKCTDIVLLPIGHYNIIFVRMFFIVIFSRIVDKQSEVVMFAGV